ncbi:MAG TPA: ammonia channel protein, partial [Corynebacterium nuruki]|nr:ammonia channel protein [Corynebacterium nuruki]
AKDEHLGIDVAVHDEAAYARAESDDNEAASDYADSEIGAAVGRPVS